MPTYVACPVRYSSKLSRLRRQDAPNGRPPACIGEHRAVVDTAARGIERHTCGQLVREYACPPRTRDVCTDLRSGADHGPGGDGCQAQVPVDISTQLTLQFVDIDGHPPWPANCPDGDAPPVGAPMGSPLRRQSRSRGDSGATDAPGRPHNRSRCANQRPARTRLRQPPLTRSRTGPIASRNR